MMADALNCRVMIDLRAMFACLSLFDDRSLLVELQVKPIWADQIRPKQLSDESLVLHLCHVESSETSDFGLNSTRVICFRDQICVPKDIDLGQSILWEAHNSPYDMHLGRNKMYRDF